MGGVGNNIEKENRTGQIHLKRSGEKKKRPGGRKGSLLVKRKSRAQEKSSSKRIGSE